MHHHRQLSHRKLVSPQSHRLSSRGQSTASIAASPKCRSGRALTEVVLIVLVPCFCLFCWTLFDSEVRKSLLAAPANDQTTPINPVFGFVKTEKGTVVSLHSQGQLRFWDLTRSVALGDMQSEIAEIRCGAYSPQQRLLAVGSAMGKLEVWHLDHPETSITSQVPALREVACCQFTPDGTMLISAGEGRCISFWEPRSLKRVHVAEVADGNDSVRDLDISDDGHYFVIGTHNGEVEVWDLPERKLIRRVRVTQAKMRPEAAVDEVAWLPGNKEFIAATRTEGIGVWNVETGERIRAFDKTLPGIRSGALSDDSKYFIAGGDGGQVGIWEVKTGLRIKSVQQRPSIVRAVTTDDTGSLVLAGHWTGQIQWHPR